MTSPERRHETTPGRLNWDWTGEAQPGSTTTSGAPLYPSSDHPHPLIAADLAEPHPRGHGAGPPGCRALPRPLTNQSQAWTLLGEPHHTPREKSTVPPNMWRGHGAKGASQDTKTGQVPRRLASRLCKELAKWRCWHDADDELVSYKRRAVLWAPRLPWAALGLSSPTNLLGSGCTCSLFKL